MKQKIVIRLSMSGDKCRTKALKVAVAVRGVESVAITGKEKDQVEVVGAEIDSVHLVRRLRRKVAYAELVSVGEAKEKEKDEKKKDGDTPVVVPLWPYYYGYPDYCCREVRETTCNIL